jgi:predicted transcriptional regulator
MSETRCIPLADDERAVTIVLPAAIVAKATAIAVNEDTTIEEMLARIVNREVGKLRLVNEVSDE